MQFSPKDSAPCPLVPYYRNYWLQASFPLRIGPAAPEGVIDRIFELTVVGGSVGIQWGTQIWAWELLEWILNGLLKVYFFKIKLVSSTMHFFTCPMEHVVLPCISVVAALPTEDPIFSSLHLPLRKTLAWNLGVSQTATVDSRSELHGQKSDTTSGSLAHPVLFSTFTAAADYDYGQSQNTNGKQNKTKKYVKHLYFGFCLLVCFLKTEIIFYHMGKQTKISREGSFIFSMEDSIVNNEDL